MPTSYAVGDWNDASRECCMVCSVDGVILALDGRAERILGMSTGSRLDGVALPGSERRIQELLDEARGGAVHDREVSLLLSGQPATMIMNARSRDDGAIDIHGALTPDGYGSALRQLSDALAEVVTLNREITQQKRALERSYRELDDSHRAIRGLHRELEEKAETLQRSADVKGRVVANISHEFRTPIHTTLGLARLLLEDQDPPLSAEQRKQVQFIRTSAEELSALIDDVLDVSRIESGRVQLHPEEFDVNNLFGSLRGMLKPIMEAPANVQLVFDPPEPALVMETDQGKVAQILRNLVANALKFTSEGEVRIRARATGDQVEFTVRDTGIGIAPEHHDLIFEEFGQVDGPHQKKQRGSGLGLHLSRRLAGLLGGTLEVRSAAGKGSTFTLAIPRVHPEVMALGTIANQPIDPLRTQILVVEDDRKTIFVYEKYLAMAGFQTVPARHIAEAREVLKRIKPAAIMLDIMLEGETSWAFLADLKKDPATADIPVIVVTVTTREEKARALGADEFWLKPIDPERLVRKLRQVAPSDDSALVLVIDDDEKARYLVRRYLAHTHYGLIEAADGHDGVALARSRQPNVIFLDFLLGDGTAFDVIDHLKSDPRTRSIPVIVVTSQVLEASERERLAEQVEAIISKQQLSRELAIHRVQDALRVGGFQARGRDS